MRKSLILILISFLFYRCSDGQKSFNTTTTENSDTKVKTAEIIINDSIINTEDVQLIIDPIWWTGDIYQSHNDYILSLKVFSQNQRYVYAIQWYQAEVNNGGHDQFFSNSTGIVWEDALNGLKKMGLRKYQSILMQSVDKMGGTIPFDRQARMNLLDSLKPDFEQLDDNFYNLDKVQPLQKELINFIKSNRKDFYFKGVITKPLNSY